MEFLKLEFLPLSDKLAQYVQAIYPLILNKLPVIFYGSPGKKKTFLIRLMAFIYSKVINTNFYINFVQLDSITKETLLGCYIPETTKELPKEIQQLKVTP